MDDLLSTLRAGRPAQATQPLPSKDNPIPTPQNCSTTQPLPSGIPDWLATAADDTLPANTTIEITTSQPDALPGRFEPDFAIISEHRTEDAVTTRDVRRHTGFRLPGPLYAIVKTVAPFGDTFKWELCDAAGTIFACSAVSAPIGALVRLENCGLWRISDVQLNVVEENITWFR